MQLPVDQNAPAPTPATTAHRLPSTMHTRLAAWTLGRNLQRLQPAKVRPRVCYYNPLPPQANAATLACAILALVCGLAHAAADRLACRI